MTVHVHCTRVDKTSMHVESLATHAYMHAYIEHSALAPCLRQKLREHSCGQGSACSCVHDTSWLECLPLHCSYVTVTDSPLGQSVTLTQALASSSSTVPTGHPHPLRHSKVQTLVGSSQVPVQGTHESTPSKYSSPSTWHSAGMHGIYIYIYIYT